MTADFDQTEDDLQTELAYLEQLLGKRPGVAPIVMHRLGAIGVEAKIDVERLKAQRAVKLKAPVPLPRRQAALARVAAAMIIVVSAPAIGGKAAFADELAAAGDAPVVEAKAPQIVIRVMDTGSGKPLAGVRIKTVADEIIATTDKLGQATLPPEYSDESVLSLEHEGYPMVLVEGSRLSARSLIAMRKFAEVGDTGLAARSHAPKKAATAADDPGERLYRMALAHSSPAKPAAPAVAAKPAEAPKPPVVAAKPVEAPKPPVVVAKPLEVSKPAAPAFVARPALTPGEAAIVIPPKPAAVALAKPVTPPDTSRAEKRVVKATQTAKASRSVAVAWSEPTLPERPVRAEKAPERVASAEAKAPRAIRVLERSAEVSAPPASTTHESPLGISNDQIGWVLPAPSTLHPVVPQVAPKPLVPKPVVEAPKPVVREVKAPVHLPMPPAAVAAVQAANAHQVAAAPQLPALPAVVLPKAPVLPKALREAAKPLPKPAAHVAPVVAPTAEAFREIRLPLSPTFGRKPTAPPAVAPTHVAQAPVVAAPTHQELAREASYRVKGGDTLSAIAQRELGSAALWPVLYNANRDKLTNPGWLPVGLALDVPRTSGSIAANGASSYVVRSGDTLSEIARSQLGDVRKWPQLFAANRHLIKNPWLIFPGQRLVVPTSIASGVSDSWATLSASPAPTDGAGSGATPRFGHAD